MDKESREILESVTKEMESLKENVNDLMSMIQYDHLHLGRICKLLECKTKGVMSP